jgi:hypothetical protein
MVDEKEPILPLGSFLFPHIFRSFRMAIQPSKLLVAFLALIVICLTGWVMDLSRTVAAVDRPPDRRTELDVYVESYGSVESLLVFRRDQDARTGVFAALWQFGASRFHTALQALFAPNIPVVVGSAAECIRAIIWAFMWHTTYSFVFFAVVFVVLSLAGGAICRIAALQFAQGEKPSLVQAARFGIRKFTAVLAAPITPVAVIIVIGVSVILLGLIGNVPVVGEILTGLFLPLSLMAAFLVTVILIGTVAGLNLMVPAIAYEDSDCFDAVSRSFGYVYAKPWRMGFYTVVATVYGAICYVFVRFFAFVLLWTTYQFLQVGFVHDNEKLQSLWPEPTAAGFLGSAAPAPDAWSMWLGSVLIRVWVLAIVGLLVSFLVSFYFSANTVIYGLMRNRVDNTPLDEVYTYSEAAPGEPSPPEISPPAAASGEEPEQNRETSE